MAHIGFLPKVGFLTDEDWCEYRSAPFYEYMRKENLSVDPEVIESFRIASPTYQSVNKGILKYDTALGDNVVHNVDVVSTIDLLDFFAELKDTAKVKEFGEVLFNKQGASGWVMTNIFKETNKEKACNVYPYLESFWLKAHVQWYPNLDTSCGKVENLKIKKILSNDHRNFIVQSAEMFFFEARMDQHLNEKLVEWGAKLDTPLKHGFVQSRGGWYTLFKHHGSLRNIIEGDVTKWDSSFNEFVQRACTAVRYHCWDKKGMNPKEYMLRRLYIAEMAQRGFVVLPTGQVVQKSKGQPSGRENTTDDNGIGHLKILCYTWRRLFGTSLYDAWSQGEVILSLYADDHVISVSEKYDLFVTYAIRAGYYKECGFLLDPLKDFTSFDMEGHTFLGLKACNINGVLRPVFDSIKAVNSITKLEKRFDVMAEFTKALSLAHLIVFGEKNNFTLVYRYLFFLKNTYALKMRIPTEGEIRSSWNALENRSDFVFPTPLSKEEVATMEAGKKTISKAEQAKRAAQSARDKRIAKQGRQRPRQVQNKAPKAPKVEVRVLPQSGHYVPPQISRFIKNASSQFDGKTIMYIKCLIDNIHTESRYPDSDPRETAVFTSVSTIDVPITMNGSGTSGKFAAAIQPIMGDISEPTHYQVAVADVPTDDWETNDWSKASSYLAMNNGRDPRLDINSSFLTSAPDQSLTIAFTVDPTRLTANEVVTGNARWWGKDGWSVATVDPSSTIFPKYDTSDGIVIPPGVWAIGTTFTGVPAVAINGTTIYASNNYAVSPLTTQGPTPEIRFFNNGAGSVAATGQQMSFGANWIVSSPTSFTWASYAVTGVPTTLAANSFTSLSGVLTINSAAPLGLNPVPGQGAIQLIRPVAQTVLASYMGTNFADGGQISAAYVQRELLVNNFFTSQPNNQYGLLQDYQNIANLHDGYNEHIKKGAYVWWSPFDESDKVFQNVAQMNADQWPAIVVSGIFQPTGVAPFTGGQKISGLIRLRVTTTFEFITNSTAFSNVTWSGSQQIIDNANNILSRQSHVTENKTHMSWISSFIKGAGKFLNDNKETIGTVARIAAPMIGIP